MSEESPPQSENNPTDTPTLPNNESSIANVNIGGFSNDRRANGLRYSYLLHRELMRYCKQNGDSVCAVIEPLVYGFLVGAGHEFIYDLSNVHKYYTRVVRDAPMQVHIYRNLDHDRRKLSRSVEMVEDKGEREALRVAREAKESHESELRGLAKMILPRMRGDRMTEVYQMMDEYGLEGEDRFYVKQLIVDLLANRARRRLEEATVDE